MQPQSFSSAATDRRKSQLTRPVRSSENMDVQLQHSGEAAYVTGRIPTIQKCLKDLGIDTKGNIPKIAVLGSGGGERAMVGLLGVLAQMGEEKMLDSILYLCGVSGSTWCMSSLYENPSWSSEFSSMKNKIVERLSNHGWTFTELLEWLEEAVDDENYSLTDFWAATVVYSTVCEIDRSCLSEQSSRTPVNPYPIYTVVDKELKQDGDSRSCWVEITPHQAGYTNLGAFVETSMFGSRFDGSQPSKRINESDMLYLQGLCGSALADGQENWEQVKAWMWDWISKIRDFFGSKKEISDSSEYKMLDCLIQLQDYYGDDEESVRLLQALMDQPRSTEYMSAEIMAEDGWLEEEEMVEYDWISAEISGSVERRFGKLHRKIRVLKKTLALFNAWTWGTKFNFLYKTPGSAVPTELVDSEKRQLEDAGLLLNSPYMAALRSDRKVNLILSFDFSEGDPFLTVTKAAELCKEAGIPFPPVHVPQEEKNMPKDFYLFRDKNDRSVPIVIHIPLFNSANVGAKVKEWRKKYTTFQGPYDKPMIEDLLKVSARNVSNNKQRILNAIRLACSAK